MEEKTTYTHRQKKYYWKHKDTRVYKKRNAQNQRWQRNKKKDLPTTKKPNQTFLKLG